MMFLNLSNIPILNIKSADYCCIISGFGKSEVINVMQNTNFTEKWGTLYDIKNLLSHIKKGKEMLKFEDAEINENKFYHHKTPIFPIFFKRYRY